MIQKVEKTSSHKWLSRFCALLLGCGLSVSFCLADESEAVEKVAAPVPLNKPSTIATEQPLTLAKAREELQLLLDETLPLATDELHKRATFYPFLAGVTHSGKVELVGIPEKNERPKPRTAIKALRKAAKQLAKKKRYRAMALYVDFVAERKDTAIKQPGIRVELEHRFPDALSVFIPYFIHSDNRISLMTPQFMPVKPHLFVVKK
ncbi:MAG: hypothetical protein MI867_17800 [Pseudomonadales bacterium]|nr:hypothetical protein [Pseudomonadales bacterium]